MANLFMEYLLNHFNKWNDLIDRGVSVYKSCKNVNQRITAQNYLHLIMKKIGKDASQFIGDKSSYYQVEQHIRNIFIKKGCNI